MSRAKRQVLVASEIAILLGISKRKVRENEAKLGLTAARIRINPRVIHYKLSVIRTLKAFEGIELPE